MTLLLVEGIRESYGTKPLTHRTPLYTEYSEGNGSLTVSAQYFISKPAESP
jgi:hypothetical protein